MINILRPKFETYKYPNFPFDKYDFYSLKYDGWFTKVEVKNDSIILWSRTKKIIKQNLIYNPEKFEFNFYGEYIFGTEWATKHRKHRQILLYPGNENLDNYSYYYLNTFSNFDFTFDRIPKYPLTEEVKLTWNSFVEEKNYEGLVFYPKDYKWGEPLGRMKKSFTVDYICMGFEQSESSRYKNRGVKNIIGGVLVDDQLIQKCKVIGLTDELKIDAFNNPTKYIGRVFEAEGKRVTKNGALRHPNFVRWRDDKLITECIEENNNDSNTTS